MAVGKLVCWKPGCYLCILQLNTRKASTYFRRGLSYWDIMWRMVDKQEHSRQTSKQAGKHAEASAGRLGRKKANSQASRRIGHQAASKQATKQVRYSKRSTSSSNNNTTTNNNNNNKKDKKKKKKKKNNNNKKDKKKTKKKNNNNTSSRSSSSSKSKIRLSRLSHEHCHVYRQGIARGTADCRHFALQKKRWTFIYAQ